MARHWRVTIHYTNGDEQTVVIDAGPRGARLEETENYEIIHFGRTEGGGWHELIAAVRDNVRSWD